MQIAEQVQDKFRSETRATWWQSRME